jgi:D-alanyl-D-alanine carboxypeptidase
MSERLTLMKLRILFAHAALLSLLLTSSPVSSRATQQPDSPRARFAPYLVAVLERDDEASIRQFFAERVAPEFRDAFPIEEHVRVFQELRRALGQFEPGGLRPIGPNAAQLTLRSKKTGEHFQIEYAVEPNPPHRLASMRWERAKQEPVLTFASAAELDAALRQRSAEESFAGVVLAARANTPVFFKAYGLADRERNLPIRDDTLFNIGSINKMFTGVAILRLAQDGRLGLDDKIGKYLKGFPAEIAERVTIRQLLQHRGGMGDYLNHPKFREDPKRFKVVDDYLDIARTTPLSFEPGASEAYSNTGFVVLGAIIEAVTGRSYYDVIEEFVYRPAGMKNSGSFERTGGPQNMAVGYTGRARGAAADNRAGPRLEPVTDRLSARGTPAGGGYSTAQDLRSFLNALLDGKLLDQRHTRLALNRYAEPKGSEEGGTIGFGGGADGINAAVYIDTRTRDMVIVLANRDEPTAERIGGAVFRNLKSLAAS